MRSRLAIIVAIVLGLVSAIAVRSYVKKIQETSQVKVRTAPVLVAAADIRKGETLRAELVNTREVGEDFLAQLVEGLGPQDLASFQGSPAVANIRRGQILQTLHFARGAAETKDVLAINPGDRAVTIRIDRISGVAGLLKPGDRVDVMVTFSNVPAAAAAGGAGGVPGEHEHELPQGGPRTGTLLQNMLILATDAMTSSALPRGVGSYSSITFRAKPFESALLLWAQQHGTIHLVYRSPDDTQVLTKAPSAGAEDAIPRVAK